MDWDTNSQFIDIKQYLLDVPPGHGVRFLMDFTIILNLENLSTLLINFRQVKKYVVPKVLDPNIVGLAEKVFSSNKSMHWSDFEVLKCSADSTRKYNSPSGEERQAALASVPFKPASKRGSDERLPDGNHY